MSSVRIGFNQATGEIFEAFAGGQARQLPSQVFFTPAYIGSISHTDPRLPTSPWVNFDHDLYFREDAYDPVTRIRRGRFYKKGTSSHIEFFIDPPRGIVLSLPGLHSLDLGSFEAPYSRIRAYLGLKGTSSEWLVLQVEPITSGEMLVTLKMTTYLGIIPELEKSRIHEAHVAKVSEKVSRLVDDFHRAGPSAIIELTRDAASEIMIAALKAVGDSERIDDLSKSADRYRDYCNKEKKSEHFNVGHSAKIIANLHNQNKATEQHKNNYRFLDEGDAELAVRCLASMIKDLGWAR